MSILFPVRRSLGRKEFSKSDAAGRNKNSPHRVYHNECVHTRRGLVPFLCKSAPLLQAEGRCGAAEGSGCGRLRGEKRCLSKRKTRFCMTTTTTGLTGADF